MAYAGTACRQQGDAEQGGRRPPPACPPSAALQPHSCLIDPAPLHCLPFLLQVARCSKRYVHDWRACPFAHPTENARRRDPRLVKYLPVPCPDYKRGICLRCAAGRLAGWMFRSGGAQGGRGFALRSWVGAREWAV